jgi:hypothetical protein
MTSAVDPLKRGGVMINTSVKSRLFRVGVTLGTLAVLVEVLGAGKKWN